MNNNLGSMKKSRMLKYGAKKIHKVNREFFVILIFYLQKNVIYLFLGSVPMLNLIKQIWMLIASKIEVVW